MPFHHLAITTKDMAASHSFYTEAIGFSLAKVDVLSTPGGGWMKHAMYDTGDQTLLAIFELHDESMGEYRTDISTGLGLPNWANHVAFDAGDPTRLEAHRQRLLAHGLGCVVMDHDNTISLYVDDPNGILIELATWVRPFFTDENRLQAQELIGSSQPRVLSGEPPMEFFDPKQSDQLVSHIIEHAREGREHRPLART